MVAMPIAASLNTPRKRSRCSATTAWAWASGVAGASTSSATTAAAAPVSSACFSVTGWAPYPDCSLPAPVRASRGERPVHQVGAVLGMLGQPGREPAHGGLVLLVDEPVDGPLEPSPRQLG